MRSGLFVASVRKDVRVRSGHVRRAMFLLPDAASRQWISSVQDSIEQEFGHRAARCLPPHLTVKGFFQSDASVATLTQLVRDLADGVSLPALLVTEVVDYHGTSVCLRVAKDPHGDGSMQHLHEQVISAVLPLVDESCEFTSGEWYGERWDPHVTLASFDVPASRGATVRRFVERSVPLQPLRIAALALIEVRAASWDRWWEQVEYLVIDQWAVADSE